MREENYVKQYVRDKNRNPIGVLVAIYDSPNDTNYIGYSFCNPRDQFSKVKGTEIALGRARTQKYIYRSGKMVFPPVPNRKHLKIYKQIADFLLFTVGNPDKKEE
jgi:hypothetical protein